MLKEFLQEQLTPTPTHSAFSASFSRRLPHPAAAATLPRTRSRSRAAISSVNKLLSAVSTILDKWSVKRTIRSNKSLNKGTVKVKDILRWKSFRDAAVIAEESSAPLNSLQFDFDRVRLLSPIAFTFQDIVATDCSSCGLESGLGFNSNTPSSSVESESESESDDFRITMDELPCWWGNYFDERKMWDQDNDVVATVSGVGPKEDIHNHATEDEKEQHSPVSVLDSPFREETSDHEYESSFDQSFANMERTKLSLLQRIQWLENLAGVSEEDDEKESVQEEEPIKDNNIIEMINEESVGNAISNFIRGEREDKEVCIKEMENDGRWTSKFEEEKEELGVELEVKLLTDLMIEVLVDLYR